MNFKCKLYDIDLKYNSITQITTLIINRFDYNSFHNLKNEHRLICFHSKFEIDSSACIALNSAMTWLPGWDDYKPEKKYIIDQFESFQIFYKRIENFKALTYFININTVKFKRKDLL